MGTPLSFGLVANTLKEHGWFFNCKSTSEVRHSTHLYARSLENSDTYLDKSVAEIAKHINLSESRLEHLFSEKTGIRLKHYLLLQKLRKSYKQVCAGKSVTEAAYEGGFADSSHLAAVSKQLLGISVSDVIKN